ncbi:glycosyl transferase family 2, partial [Pedobacter sp. HMWF019]|uniref:glycosyltransferase n=1 Tax=Pedobacter sp. HMWF019 TaxID=2056856 RepID=UPI000D392B39
LLITHYNRSSSLIRLLKEFKALNCVFDEIIVSDDGSKSVHLEKILSVQKEFNMRVVTTEKNKGLGNNINKGQDAVKSAYTLYIQEDFIPQPIFPEKLGYALGCMEKREDIDMVRFYSYEKYPYLKPIGEGFSEMIFNPFLWGYKKFYYYSDHPHLRRSSFFSKFGRYAEGIKSDVTEYRMMLSFLRNKGKSLYYEKYKELFDQSNSEEEPSTVKRQAWKQKDNFPTKVIRDIFRYVKFNFNYFRP